MTALPAVGARAHLTRRYGAAQIAEYVALGGAPAAQRVPEPLVDALFSYLLGVELPGRGTNYLKQESRYLAPAGIDETLTASVEVTRVRTEKRLVDLATLCTGAGGRRVCEGRALVYVGDVAPKDDDDAR